MPFLLQNAARLRCRGLLGAALAVLSALAAWAQGPAPENGNTLFPGGAFLAYESGLTARRAPVTGTPAAALRPTLAHEGKFTFTWGFRRDFDLTVQVPVATHRFHFASAQPGAADGGTGLGDVTLGLKYRFLRKDSDRGTTQASVTIGPKLPTGRTDLRAASGTRLAAGLQPGSGSTDLLLGLHGTYTGLFHVHRLVADGSFQYALRTKGSQQTKLADTTESRLWIAYRPYQSSNVGREWWIGPLTTWTHGRRDSQNGISVAGSAGDTVRLGAVTYFSPGAGLHLWFSAEFPLGGSGNGVYSEERRRFRFGLTRQFRLKR